MNVNYLRTDQQAISYYEIISSKFNHRYKVEREESGREWEKERGGESEISKHPHKMHSYKLQKKWNAMFWYSLDGLDNKFQSESKAAVEVQQNEEVSTVFGTLTE